MNKKEFAVLITALSTNYRNFNLENETQMNIWYEMLKDIDYKVANLAIKKIMMESPYQPTIADIRKAVSEVKNGYRITAGEAWEKVLAVVRDFGHYRAQEALKSLDAVTRRAVECVGFQNICFSEKIGVERSHFISIYDQLIERERKQNMLPEDFRQEMLEARERISREQIAAAQDTVKQLAENFDINN
jgi:loader and inhibitor of G40P protein